jgi:hypothetical protein
MLRRDAVTIPVGDSIDFVADREAGRPVAQCRDNP